MSSFLHRLKSAWDTFVLGRPLRPHSEEESGHCADSYNELRQAQIHGSAPPATMNNWRAKLDWHEAPLVGRYVRTKIDTWWTDMVLKNLGYELRLIAPGPKPTAAQMANFEALAARIPELIAKSNLEPIPAVDPWGAKAPPFDMHTARIDSIIMNADGTCRFSLTVDPSENYMGAPLFYVAQDHSLISAEWSV